MSKKKTSGAISVFEVMLATIIGVFIPVLAASLYADTRDVAATVSGIYVEPGQEVEGGDSLITLSWHDREGDESQDVHAPVSGKVSKVFFDQGSDLTIGRTVMEIATGSSTVPVKVYIGR